MSLVFNDSSNSKSSCSCQPRWAWRQGHLAYGSWHLVEQTHLECSRPHICTCRRLMYLELSLQDRWHARWKTSIQRSPGGPGRARHYKWQSATQIKLLPPALQKTSNPQPETFVDVRSGKLSHEYSMIYRIKDFSKLQKEGMDSQPAIRRIVSHIKPFLRCQRRYSWAAFGKSMLVVTYLQILPV